MAVAEYQNSRATTHGLSNRSGENNCFINSVIQVLWHLNIFRNHFGQLQNHICYELECVFCTLKELFVNFQYSESPTLPPNFVRNAMAKCYMDSGRFQLSKMDYAVECYEAVLKQLHAQITGTDWDTTCTHPQCLPHKIFSYSSCQIDKCECGATSEPFPSEDILFYISADNLLKAMKKSKKSHKEILRDGIAFGQVLRECLTTDKKHSCPDSISCKKPARIETMLLRSPYTINLSLSWSSEISTKETVVDVLKSVGHCINIKQMFSLSLDETADSKEYHLSGIINYYGHHFSAFVYNTNLAKWIFCDDASYREVGDDWGEVIELVKRARYQPELLVYSTRGVDIWSEEEKRKLTVQPNIANYLSIMTESINTTNSTDRSAIHGSSPQNQILPANLISTPPVNRDLPPISSGLQVPSHLTRLAAVPPQEGLVPSAPPPPAAPVPPPPTGYKLTDRKIHYPPNSKHVNSQFPTNLKSANSSPQAPNKNNPVVLLRMEKTPVVPPTYTPLSRTGDKNSNTNNGNQNHEQEPDLLMDFETIPRPSDTPIDPFLFVSSDSSPNLLLDIENSSNHKLPPNTINIKTEENLIEFIDIKRINSDDVYDEMFRETSSTSPFPTQTARHSPVLSSKGAYTQQIGNKNPIL